MAYFWRPFVMSSSACFYCLNNVLIGMALHYYWESLLTWYTFYQLFFSFIDCDIKAVFMFHQDQKGFPDGLFAVKMYALTTEAPKKVHRTRSKTQSNRPRKIMWSTCLVGFEYLSKPHFFHVVIFCFLNYKCWGV